MTFSRWGDTSPFPSIPFRWVFQPLKRPVPSGAGIVTAYTDGVVTLRSNKRVDGYHEAADLSTYQGVEPGDFVVHGLDILRGSVGVSDSAGAMSPVCTVLRAEEGHDPRYHGYLIRAQAASGYTRALARGIREGGADFRRWDTLASLSLLSPPLDAQRRIAAMLDAETSRIDTLIAKNERVLDLLAVREARILEDGIYGAAARPVGIHYLATYVNGYPFKPEDRSDDGTPIIRIAQLLGDTRQQDFYAGTPDSYSHIDSGDLIFSWSATLAAKVWDGGPAFLNQHLFKVEPHDGIDRDWLLHALNAAVPRMKSKTHGSTMTHITRPMMTQVRVPQPPLEEQRRIASDIRVQFDRLVALRAKVDRQQELLRLRRQALITAAVTGEIDDRGGN